MRTRNEIIERLTTDKLIAVVRARAPEQVAPLSKALLAGGISAIEITMTTPRAIDAIRALRESLGQSALIGVGTVLDTATARAAIAAGAEFVVSPVGKTELISVAHASDKPVMLGAYTATEAQAVHEAGADFVKLFPADTLGPGYIKALRAPLPHLRIVPTGGVDLRNVADFLKAGCAAVGLGSSLVSADILSSGRWDELEARARQFARAAAEASCR